MRIAAYWASNYVSANIRRKADLNRAASDPPHSFIQANCQHRGPAAAEYLEHARVLED